MGPPTTEQQRPEMTEKTIKIHSNPSKEGNGTNVVVLIEVKTKRRLFTMKSPRLTL
jgi:hypothetical protein